MPQETENSQLFKLNELDWQKIGNGALIVVISALLTYLSEWLPKIDFGVAIPLVMAFWGIVVNVVRKWLTNSKGQFGKAENKIN